MANNGKPMFDINNLEQAKRIMEQILSITTKVYASGDAMGWMEDGDKLEKLYAQLNSLSKTNLKYANDLLNNGQKREAVTAEMNNLLEESDKYYKSYVTSQAKLNLAIDEEMVKRKEITKQEENRVKLTQNKQQYEEQFNRILAEQTEELEKQAKLEYQQMDRKKRKQYGSESDYVANKTNTFKENFQKSYNNAYNSAVQDGSTFTSKNIEVLGKKARQKTDKDFKLDEDYTKALNANSTALKAAKFVVDELLDVAKHFINIFKDGIKEQSDIYENTFHNISVRSGVSEAGYQAHQSSTNKTLNYMGMNDVVKVSDVQNMWNELANNGVNEADMFNQGLDNVITQRIVPYLEVSSQSFSALNSRLGPSFIKQIRGINEANLEIAGNNYSTSDMMKQIIAQLEPMSDEALQNMAQNSTEFTTLVNRLQSEFGYSKAQAESIGMKAFEAQKYQDRMITSGDVADTLYITRMQELGINPNTDMAGAAATIADSNAFLSKTIGSNLGGTANQALVSTLGLSALGLTTDEGWAAEKQNKAGGTAAGLLEDIRSRLDLDKYTKEAEKKLASGDNDTTRYKQNTTLQNMATDVAIIREQWGEWYDLADGLVSKLVGMLVSFLVGDFLVSMLGSGIGKAMAASGEGIAALAGTGGAAGILAAGGGIALGAAAGVAIANAVHDGVMKAAKKENEQDKAKANMKTRDLAEKLNVSEDTASVMRAGSNIYESSKNWLGASFDQNEAASLFGAKLGAFDTLDEKDFIQTMNAATKETDTLKYNKAKIGRSLMYKGIGAGSATLQALATAWLIGLYSQGYTGKNANVLKALQDTLNISASPTQDTLVELMNSHAGLSRSAFNRTVQMMKDADMWLWNENGQWVLPNEGDYDKVIALQGIDPDHAELLNTHRYGLDSVPYDGYKAVLHEGEAVLTSSTANEMRSLVDEYRENNNQSANFDVIIQSQTVAIISKMDEILSAITNRNTNTGTSDNLIMDTVHNSNNQIRSSMLRMTSSKQFG